MKKLGAAFLALVLIFTMAPLGSLSVWAADSGYYTYTVNGFGAVITKYQGPETDVVIPSQLGGSPVIGIDYRAFDSCLSITSVTLPDTLTAIAEFAFRGCTKLTSVTIPKNVTSVNNSSFAACTKLTQYLVDSENAKFSSLNGVLFNKTKTQLVAYPAGLSGSYEIPNSVTEIGYKAFIGDIKLTGVTIPTSVLTIGDNAFDSCFELTAVTIPGNVTTIGSSAFQNCNKLNSLVISNGVTNIGGGAFGKCTALTTATIPASVTNIGGCIFGGSSGVSAITVDANNQNYVSENGVLFNKLKTEIIEFPGGKTGSYAIPDGVNSINAFAFAYCAGLTNVTFPSSVTLIDDASFYNCTGLTDLTVGLSESTSTFIGYGAFSNCTGLTNLTIGNGVIGIDMTAFESCTKLTNVTIGNKVSTIDYHTFYQCTSLTKVVIGSGVTKLSDEAFYGCTNLTAAYFMGKAPTSVGFRIFGNCAPTFKVYYISGKTGFSNPWYGYNTATFTPLETAPTNLTVVNKTSNSVTLSWSPVTGATGYDVYNGTTKLTVAPLSATTYTVTELTPNTTYSFTVKAVNSAVESPASTALSVTTEENAALPGDINGDREVNLKDVTILSRYVAGWSDIIVIMSALDVDADKTVGLKDVTLLSRYVAGWNVTIS